MELQITGTNMQITPEIRRRIERKLGKLNRHLPNIIESKIEVSEEKTKSAQQHYLVRATVAGKGSIFHSEERGEDLFQAIDKMAAILTRRQRGRYGRLRRRVCERGVQRRSCLARRGGVRRRQRYQR